MKKFYKTGLLVAFLLSSSLLKSQVLISLLFGDKLNSPKIEFGLVGGLNRSYFLDYNNSSGLNNFNIGFYFHLLLKNNSYLSTGVLVKSNSGATGMPTYSLENPDVNNLFSSGTLTTIVNYFYVPILFQQRFYQRFYAELGFQVGLRSKAYDYFDNNVDGNDLSYKIDVRDDYVRLDAGLMGGLGFKFSKKQKSPAVGVNYYYGLVNVSKLENTNIRNSGIYIYGKIPIGVKKAEREQAEKEKAGNIK